MALSMLLMAGPVALMPLVHWAGRWGAGPGTLQAAVVQAIAAGCPMLGDLDAFSPTIRLDWATLPGMYELSGLGQEIPMDLPRWWASCLIYLGAAVVVGVAYQIVQSGPARDRV
jgi:hypothetical protein